MEREGKRHGSGGLNRVEGDYSVPTHYQLSLAIMKALGLIPINNMDILFPKVLNVRRGRVRKVRKVCRDLSAPGRGTVIGE